MNVVFYTMSMVVSVASDIKQTLIEILESGAVLSY